MGKLAGSMDCSSPEAMHMVVIVKKALLQGKDMWDTVAMRYDMSNHSHWPERDMESLRRKFKSLYSFTSLPEFEEASYTKQKRLKAEKVAAELKCKLNPTTHSASNSGSDLVRTITVLCADADRADTTRAEATEVIRREERRAEREYFENRRQEERRVDREAQEERHREDHKDARQHMQDTMIMLSSLKNGSMPGVTL
ncbi:uncharacterized protein IUM83_13489 [Phytophthora cinnamomi]|uniref:uncharacterized protein n=1 Tax=Phytophthora cinnamomi TaxID=4785 RepID=UPI00355AC57B|nr:hypothetical protein IUM83_13489 [Phytophthora cinnamomi]